MNDRTGTASSTMNESEDAEEKPGSIEEPLWSIDEAIDAMDERDGPGIIKEARRTGSLEVYAPTSSGWESVEPRRSLPSAFIICMPDGTEGKSDWRAFGRGSSDWRAVFCDLRTLLGASSRGGGGGGQSPSRSAKAPLRSRPGVIADEAAEAIAEAVCTCSTRDAGREGAAGNERAGRWGMCNVPLS